MKQIVLAMVLVILASVTVQAQSVPPLVNYQGMLTDASGNPLTGTKKIEFNLYDAATGGNKVWGPQVFSSVPLVNGMFNVILGTTDTAGRSIAEAFGGKDRYLGIKVGDGNELAPRQQILSTPFAINAQNADNAKNANLLQNKSLAELTSVFREPDYDSGWFEMSSQAGEDSFKEIEHGLGVYPSRVKVLVKAIDGPNEGFIFEGAGSAQAHDNDNAIYGGVVFAYNQTKIRIWAPDRRNHSDYGSMINVYDGWGGEVNAQMSHSAEVKVLVWK